MQIKKEHEEEGKHFFTNVQIFGGSSCLPIFLFCWETVVTSHCHHVVVSALAYMSATAISTATSTATSFIPKAVEL